MVQQQALNLIIDQTHQLKNKDVDDGTLGTSVGTIDQRESDKN